MIAVFLDACVFVPIHLINVLLTAAEKKIFLPHWSPRVAEEAVRAIKRIRPDLADGLVHNRFLTMQRAFPNASMSGSSEVPNQHLFPDPDDIHVIASAMAADISTIVTANVRDFPARLIESLGVTVVTPDELLLSLLANHQSEMIQVIIDVADSLQSPPQTAQNVLTALEAAGVPRFVATIKPLMTRT
ncbi:MAG: PIN domain-containing protein [Propionibacteriaceae bacterium]|nr:PIN domain-containing protein [Propionibacteriaceae bacterium]